MPMITSILYQINFESFLFIEMHAFFQTGVTLLAIKLLLDNITKGRTRFNQLLANHQGTVCIYHQTYQVNPMKTYGRSKRGEGRTLVSETVDNYVCAQ